MNLLYKYFVPERKDVLETCTLRATQFEYLNDPFEVYPDFSEWNKSTRAKVQTYVVKKRQDLSIIPFKNLQFPSSMEQKSEVDIAENELWNRFRKVAGLVVCFTERPNNLLMWAHYAGNFSGFVLGFDSNHAFFYI